MAVVSRRQPSALVSNGLAMATVALNIAGAATDSVPIAKQILNSAAHISAVAERIQKKREAMYTLVEKVDIYATQINIAVAGRILDASLQRRLERLYSVFLKIEALVDAKADSKNNALTRAWRNVVTKPNRAETLVAELEREIQLFHLRTAVQLSWEVDYTAHAVEDTARAVAADAKYDGQIRILRDCDIEKLDVIRKRETDEGVVVWASARVKRQLMVIRYLESQPNAETNTMCTMNGSSHWKPLAPYHEYLENIKKVSTVRGSHPHIVQLYGRHVQGPGAVFRAGTFDLWNYLRKLRPRAGNEEDIALKRLTLAYKILDASAHLESVHRLTWKGYRAIVDENGEPRIGLFDDIVRANPGQRRSIELGIYSDIFCLFNTLYSKERGAVEHVHNSSLHTIITEQLRDGHDTNRLQQVWDIIRQEQLCVGDFKHTFPVISGNLSLSQESIDRARLHLETNTKGEKPAWDCLLSFTRHVLAGGANIPSQIYMSIQRFLDDYEIKVLNCTHDNSHIRYDRFDIYIPAGCPLLAEVARAVGLPDDLKHWDGYDVLIYQRVWDGGEQTEDENEIGDGEGADKDSGDSAARGSLEEVEDEEYETADEGETSSEAAGEQ